MARKYVDVERHSRQCTICNAEPDMARRIRDGVLHHEPLQRLADDNGVSLDVVKRHASAFGLREEREKDLKGILRAVIARGSECLGKINVTPSNMIEATKALAKLEGQWIDRSIDLSKIFPGKTDAQVNHFAETGEWIQDDTPVKTAGPSRPQ